MKTKALDNKARWNMVLDRLRPVVYIVEMWLFATVAVSLFIKDFVLGAGIVSSVGLFYIAKGNYFAEFYKGGTNVESDEAEGV